MPAFPIINALLDKTIAARWKTHCDAVSATNPSLGNNEINQRFAAGCISAAAIMRAYSEELDRLDTDTRNLVQQGERTHPTLLLYDAFHCDYTGPGLRQTMIDLSGDRDSFNTEEMVQQGKWIIPPLFIDNTLDSESRK